MVSRSRLEVERHLEFESSEVEKLRIIIDFEVVSNSSLSNSELPVKIRIMTFFSSYI